MASPSKNVLLELDGPEIVIQLADRLEALKSKKRKAKDESTNLISTIRMLCTKLNKSEIMTNALEIETITEINCNAYETSSPNTTMGLAIKFVENIEATKAEINQIYATITKLRATEAQLQQEEQARKSDILVQYTEAYEDEELKQFSNMSTAALLSPRRHCQILLFLFTEENVDSKGEYLLTRRWLAITHKFS